MKKIVFVFLFYFCLFFSASKTFAQCSCLAKYCDITAMKELEIADAVFVGKIIEVQKTEPDKSNRYTETVELKVKEVWKGEIDRKITIVNEIYGCINGYDVNEEFLIYAYKNKNDTYSTACCCSRTTILNKAEKDLREFKENGLKSQKTNDIESYQNEKEETAYFKTGFPPTMKEMTEASEKLREFIWKHWRDKRNGTVTQEGINTHGEKYVTVYQIKCVESKNCKIFIDIERENVGRGGIKADKSVEKRKLVAISVDRIVNPTDYYLNGKVEIIADNAEKAVNFYYIRLKDKDGGIIHLL